MLLALCTLYVAAKLRGATANGATAKTAKECAGENLFSLSATGRSQAQG